MYLYRFALTNYVDDLSGYGAKLYGGRWNSVGKAMLYTSCSPSLAMLEFVCNTSGIAQVKQTSLLTLQLPDSIDYETISLNDLPDDWQKVPTPDSMRKIGDRWLNANKIVGLKVPSAVMPVEFNFLINPAHKDFLKLVVDNVVPMNVDNRVIR
jgi:RES domain-containing protein